jgi:hypothetical protein
MVEAQPVDSRPARFMTWFALIIALASDAAYLSLTRGQAGGQQGLVLDVFTLPFVAGYVFVLASLLAASLMHRWKPAIRTSLRAAASGGLLVLGVIAIFSIGLPLVIAGAMATGATVRTLRGPMFTRSSVSAVAAAIAAVAVLVAGFEVTERVIVCPDQGTVTGGGAGFVTGPYHYECINGRLAFHSGSCSGGGTTTIDSSGHATSSGC